MTEPECIKVQVKISSIVAMALLVASGILLFEVLVGMHYGSWDFAKNFLVILGMLFLYVQTSPIYISPDGIEGRLFFLKPVFLSWAEVDYKRVCRRRFMFLFKLQFTWFIHRTILFPGDFHIKNREEVLSLIERYTAKYRV